MYSKTKYKMYKLSDARIEEQYECFKADAEEREEVLQQFKTILNEQEEGVNYGWQGYEVGLKKGSSLYRVHMPGRMAWNKLADRTIMMDELRLHRVPDMASTRINGSGHLEIYRDEKNAWEMAVLDFHPITYVYKNLAIVGDIASQAGGYVYTQDTVDVDQWLRFHDFKVPLNAAETKNLIAFFEFDPQVDELDNYWRQLSTDDPSLFVLSAEQQTAVRQATAKIMGPNTKLLDKLYRETGRAIVTHSNAAARVVELVSHTASQDYARKYLDELGWFGAQSGQPVSAQDLKQLLITAILLDLSSSFGSAQHRKSIGGFELYAPTNVERPSAVVREELQAFLYTKNGVDPAVAPLASHLLMAEIAPEFLVKGVPSSLSLGSVAWVVFCRGVTLVEAVRKGASRVLTYEQIMAYADLESVSEALIRLRELALIDPIVDWALINGVVTLHELTQSEKETTERAITVFQAYAENFTHLAHVYSNPMPSRKDIAMAALKKAAPTCDFLDGKVIYQRPGLYASPSVMSMVELHMSGDLVDGQWDLRAIFPDSNAGQTPELLAGITNDKRPTHYDPAVVSIYKQFPQLQRLAPNNNEFHRQMRGYLANLNGALATNIKLAISHMVPHDLDIFLKGNITFFTLRNQAIQRSSRRVGGPLTIESDFESQEGNDAVRGRFGLVMYASHGSSVACYELFTLTGELRKNDALKNLITTSGKLQAVARMDFKGDLKAAGPIAPLEMLPVLLCEYEEGVPNTSNQTSSEAVIEKLGVLNAAVHPVMREKSTFKNFVNPQLERIANFIVSNHQLRTFNEIETMATVPTKLESERKRGNEIATYIVDLAVPFKKCIEDLSSGEHNRVVDGIYGCIMDAIALGGAFAGAGAKALSISSKAISLSAKAARLTKLALLTSVSVFNPLDGVPTALLGVGKLVHKGALRFNRQAQEILGLAKSQLSKLNGHHKSYNLVHAANNPHVGHGTWRPHGSTADALTVVAARSDLQWYALDRRGRTWGPKLNNFTFVTPIQSSHFIKTMPLSYTRQFIEQALPQARTKIDNAINVLTRHDFTQQRNFVVKLLMGSSSADASNRLLDYLRLIRADFAGLSISNMFLDPFKDTHNIAAFDSSAYQKWKTATEKSETKFIELYTSNLNMHFISLGFNHDVIADDLIHELFHGIANSSDVGYARDAGSIANSGQLLDVAALLNLASGRLVTEGGSARHDSSKAFDNADSLAVTTSLLSQLYTDSGLYDHNMAILSAALEEYPDSAVEEPVLITLNILPAHQPGSGNRTPGTRVE